MSNETQPPFVLMTQGLGRGCLLGLGLVGLFFVISLSLYALMNLLGLPRNIVLLVAIGGGPILGTILGVAGFYAWAAGRKQQP